MRNESRTRKILPVLLMLEGRPCLVVGGGRVALRKIGHLREAGAHIVVVSDSVVPELQAPIAAGQIEHRRRDFKDSDVRGHFLVVAATDNPAVNGHVIALCRRRGILCSAADAHWTDGDFITPATLRKSGLVLTVATGGQSCRRSRLIKDHLARRIDRLGPADLVAVRGTWRPVSRKNRRVPDVAARLQELWGIYEFAILDMPTRFELLAVAVRDGDVEGTLEYALGAAVTKRQVWRGTEAVRHAATLAWGPDCDTLDQALRSGVRAGWAGTMTRDWIEGLLRYTGLTKPMRDDAKWYERLYESIVRGL